MKGITSRQERQPRLAARGASNRVRHAICSIGCANTRKRPSASWKISAQIFEEAEGRFLVFAQPIAQSACRTLFLSPLGANWGARSRRAVTTVLHVSAI